MAEDKVVLLALEIDMNDVVKDMSESKKAVQKLKDEIKELSKAEEVNNDLIVEKEILLKSEQTILNKNISLTKDLIVANKSQVSTADDLTRILNIQVDTEKQALAQNKQLLELRRNLSKSSKTYESDVKKINQQVDKNNALLKKNASQEEQRTKGIGKYADGIKKVGFQFLAATGITIGLTAAQKGLKEIIESTQITGDAFAAAMRGAKESIIELTKSIALGNWKDLGERLKDAAERGRDYAKALDEITERNYAVTIAEKEKNIQVLQQAKIYKDTTKSVAERLEAVEKVKELETNFLAESKALAEAEYKAQGNRLFGLKKEISDQDLRLLGLKREQVEYKGLLNLKEDELKNFIVKYQQDEKLREQAERYLQIQKDVAKAERLIAIEDSQRKKGQQAQQADLGYGVTVPTIGTTGVDRALLGERKKAISEITDEVKTYSKIIQEYGASADTEIKPFVDAWSKLLDTQIKFESSTSEAEITYQQLVAQITGSASKISPEKIIEPLVLAIRDFEDEGIDFEFDFEKIDADFETLSEKLTAFNEKLKERALVDEANRFELAQKNIVDSINFEQTLLDKRYKQEVEYAEKIGADTLLVEEKYSKLKKDLALTEVDAKLSLASDFANNIAVIAGKNTKVGKLASATAVGVSAIQGAIGSFASLSSIPIVGPVLGAAAAAASIASGVKSVKDIYAVKSGLPGDSGGTPPSIAAPKILAVKPQGISPELNAGIVSRETIIEKNNGIVLQPTLVTNEVTASQNKQVANSKTAAI